MEGNTANSTMQINVFDHLDEATDATTGMGPVKLVVTDPVSGRAMSEEELEKGFAATFVELSFEERHDALHDIHGVADPIQETQELVATSLENLDREIKLMHNKPAYEIALSKCPEYVRAIDFRMKFLRAEQFDVTKAAARLISHFEKKLELFGEELVAREVRWSDLSTEDIAVLQSGYIRLLPLRDRAGRLVLFHARSLCPHMTISTRLRVAWYFIQLASQDLSTQRKGLVAVYWLLGSRHAASDLSSLHLGRNAAASMGPCFSAYPVRMAAIHLCFQETSFRYVFNFGMMVMERTTRVRCKAHIGTMQEVMYFLMSYGIPKAILPIDENTGKVEVEDFRTWLMSLQDYEKDDAMDLDRPGGGVTVSHEIIEIPGEHDVLLGRGKIVEGSTGNLLLKKIIGKNSVRYENASRFEKMAVSQAVYLRMKKGGSRFLKREGTYWIEVDESVAREKIAHGFRNYKARGGLNSTSTGTGNQVSPLLSS